MSYKQTTAVALGAPVSAPTPSVAPKLQATGSITVVAQSALVDGDTFTLDDGIHTATVFEFDNDSSVGSGHIAIDLTGLTTAATVRDAVISAINGVGATLAITASNGGASTVSLVQDDPTATGSAANAESVADSGFTISGMTTPTGATTWTYKLVAVDALGNKSAAGSAGTTAAGGATLNSTHFNRLTWTDTAGAVSFEVYRTVASGTPSTTGKIATVLAGVQTLDDTGLAGDSVAAPGSPSGTPGYSQIISVKQWEKFTAFVNGLTGTWKLEISGDADSPTHWYEVNSTVVTNSGYVDCIFIANFARIRLVTITAGTPTATIDGLYSHEGG